MVFAKRALILLGVLLILPAADAAAQAHLAKACKEEILKAEAKIAQARRQPEYNSDTGRRVLSTADRSVYQARQHAIKSEARNCVSVAQRVSAQLAPR
jgi:hypothetical protein